MYTSSVFSYKLSSGW